MTKEKIFGDDKNASHRVSVKIIATCGEKLFLMKEKSKETFCLIGGGVDKGESLMEAIKREFTEETGNNTLFSNITLLHAEIIQFELGGQFDAVVNIFYHISFDKEFDMILSEHDYEERGRYSLADIKKMNISKHSKVDLLIRTIEQ